MNKRIKELALEAMTYVTHNPKANKLNSGDMFDEKFAQLIVREMLVTCEEHPAWTGRMIGEQIKQHFGVEE